MCMPELGPITKAICEGNENGPPPIIVEWLKNVAHAGQIVFFWAAATRGCSWMHMRTHLGDEPPAQSEVERVPPANVERLVSPLSHEGRIKIMQALYGGSLTPSELTARTGFQGGGLYHHLRELKYASYLCEDGGRYALTQLGRQLLITVALIAKEVIVDRGEEGLAAGTGWAQDTP